MSGRRAARELALGRRGRPTLTLRNRLVTSPMERNYGTTDGRVTEQYLDYLVARAAQGAAVVSTEATFVREDGKGRTHQLGLHDDSVLPSHRRLVDALHANGALVAVELNHGGRTAQEVVSGRPPVAPSANPCEVAGGQLPLELSTRGCWDLVDAFAAAASRAVEAGYDLMTLHGGHGYLIHQFMSPRTNPRRDEFGVPERFANEVIAAVRRAAPTTAIGLRLSVVEGVEGGLSPLRQREIAGRLDLDALDYLDLSAGSYESGEWIVQSGEWAPGLLSEYASAYRELGLPLGMAGRLNSPEAIEETLASGVCDFVSLGRAAHADPAFLGAALRGGSYRPCIACNVCIDNLGVGQVTCTVNPAVGRSRVPLPTPGTMARVLVVGAGPAGLTAARELAESGAAVTVLDGSTRLGGSFALAESMRSTPDFHRFTAWMREEAERLGIELRLGVPIRLEGLGAVVAEYGADAVVVATGGAAAEERVVGASLPRVSEIRAWLRSHAGVLDGTVAAPEAVTIWGADSVAMSVADTLAGLGTRVLLIGDQESIAPEAGRRAKILAVPRLEASSLVEIVLDARLVEIGEETVRVQDAAGERSYDAAGDVLLSRSVVPLPAAVTRSGREAALSRAAGVPVVLAGTVVESDAPIVSTATKSGFDAAQRLAGRLAAAEWENDLTEGALA